MFQQDQLCSVKVET